MSIDDALVELIVGGAIYALQSVFSDMKEKVKDNERKAWDLELTSRRYEQEIKDERNSLQAIRRKNDLKEKLAQIDLRFRASQEKADAIFRDYEKAGKQINDMNEDISMFFKTKSMLKEKLRKTVKNSDEYNDLLTRIRVLNSMIQNTIKSRNSMKVEREKILANLRENNHITRALNEERKGVQEIFTGGKKAIYSDIKMYKGK